MGTKGSPAVSVKIRSSRSMIHDALANRSSCASRICWSTIITVCGLTLPSF